MIRLDRRDIINDDLGFFTDTATALGAANDRHQDKRAFRRTARHGPLTSSISSSGDPTPSFAFEFGGQSARIQQSLSTVESYGPSGLVTPDFKGAINVTSDGVEGVEIAVPTFSLSLTKFFAIVDLTSAYQLTIAGRT